MTTAKPIPVVSITTARTGVSAKANELGMRPMQERAYEKRGEQYLLIKSPPASGKSRALMFIALDKPLMSYDTLWYTWVDWEAFIVLDEQLDERYAHLSIGRVGLGRKFNYNWRAEFVYALWHARDEVDMARPDQDIDHVFRLSVKYYITPPNRRVPAPGAVP